MSNADTGRIDEPRARLMARQVIARVGAAGERRAEAAVEALASAPNDAVRKIILETSVSAPDDVTAAFVQAALRSDSVQVVRAAADLLLDLKGAHNALDVIAECLRHSDSAVRRRAVEALEVVSQPGAVGLLAEALGSADDSVRRAATSTLGLVAGSKYHPLRQALLAGLGDPDSDLNRVIASSPDVQLRREVAQALGYTGADQALPLLEAFIKDGDALVRREAVISLSALNRKGAVPLLAACIDDQDFVVAGSALDALADEVARDSSAMLDYVRQALAHPVAEVRRHAVLMLDHFAPAQVKDALAKALHDEDFEVQLGAHELMRRDRLGSATDWLTSQAELSEDERTLLVWEAGNMGIESSRSLTGGLSRTARAGAADDVAPMLEEAARGGDPSVRAHAISELLELRDIADSPALRAALDCDDESVRSRAAAGLSSTRDAGLLVDLLRRHGDTLVRRSACEALADNPGGLPGAARSIRFTATRTVGIELMSNFLEALRDPDEGVRLLACRAIGRYLEFKSPMPQPVVLRALRELAQDESVSSLVRDAAAEVADAVVDSEAGKLLAGAVDGLLQQRGAVAREAHALRLDEQSGRMAVDLRAGLNAGELLGRWTRDLGLSGEQALALEGALKAGGALPDELAQAVMLGLVRELAGCMEAVHHAARAGRLMGQNRWAENLDRWVQALRGSPQLAWGADQHVAAWRGMLERVTARATAGALAAREALKDRPDPAVLDELAADRDDWVRLAAMTARAELTGDAGGEAEAMAQLCRAHAGDHDFDAVLGPAALALAAEGHAESLDALESVLDRAATDLRYDLTQRLMFAASRPQTAGIVRRRLGAGPQAGIGRLCLALALRGGGGALKGLKVGPAPGDADVERRCAQDCLLAMEGDAQAAERLKGLLRGGDHRERYCGAVYLGLARVHSALPVFAAVSDQDAPWPVRTFCAGMLIRRGHQLGTVWFGKSAQNVRGAQLIKLVTELARATEDTIPLMLYCEDVNVGRFV